MSGTFCQLPTKVWCQTSWFVAVSGYCFSEDASPLIQFSKRKSGTGKSRTADAFVYIMHEDRPLGVPSAGYMRTCLEGYDAFRFDRNVLLGAYFKSREVCSDEG